MTPRMKRSLAWTAGTLSLAGLSLAAMAQRPESLLPPGFDQPSPHPSRDASRAPEHAGEHPAQERSAQDHVVQGLAGPPGRPPVQNPAAASQAASAPVGPLVVQNPGASASPAAIFANLPQGITSFAQLMALPPDQVDELLGLKPTNDIPPGARRSLNRVGLIDSREGGLPPFSLAHQDEGLVRAALAGDSGHLVSRWGHIMLRRALASRLDAPDGMDPAEFTALRAALLLRMGEGDAARAVVQDVDPDNYSADLTQTALDAYAATEDFTGICPVVTLDPNAIKTPEWQVVRAMCEVFSGNASGGFQQIDHLTWIGAMPRIDMLLAQKYAGAAGLAGKGGRRAVTIAWDGVDDMTPWRYGLTLAVGLAPPTGLMQGADVRYDEVAALAPALGLGGRADASDRAGGTGVLSAAAMVDLYSQIYDDDAVTGDAADRALALRDAYLADTPDARLKAMKQLWDGASGPLQRYAREVLTAYAAARLPVSGAMAGDAGDIIASMLTAGLDANALRWAGVVDNGSEGWALLQLAAPKLPREVSAGALEGFRKQDTSDATRKSAFLLAGLAGLSRVSDATRRDVAGRFGIDLESSDRWTQAIDQAASVGNPTLVALLAGLGMQGDGWNRMTPRYLYHIVGALNRVGLSGEARMIAAEAVARG